MRLEADRSPGFAGGYNAYINSDSYCNENMDMEVTGCCDLTVWDRPDLK